MRFTWLSQQEATERFVELLLLVWCFDQLEQEMVQFQESVVACRFRTFEKDKIFENILKKYMQAHKEVSAD